MLVSVVFCLDLGILSAYLDEPYLSTTYQALEKPWFTPPHWLFMVVWTFLYVAMGIVLFILWQNKNKEFARSALILFFVQLTFNFGWSVIFFLVNDIYGALVIAGALLASIIATLFLLMRVSRLAAWLMVPYLVWVAFSVFFNTTVILMNR